MRYEYDDGGRSSAGFRGECGDCGTRAAAIALSLPYKQVYDELNSIRKEMLSKARSERMKKQFSSSVRNGTATDVMHEFMKRHGWAWTAKMSIGSGCTVHVDDMPHSGRYVLRVARHYCAVVDGVIRDTFWDDGDACVYGYWSKVEAPIRDRQHSELYYVTTTDSNGNVLAWVEETKFVSLFNHLIKPFSSSFEDVAYKKMEKEVAKYVPISELAVRKAIIDVRWESCGE